LFEISGTPRNVATHKLIKFDTGQHVLTLGWSSALRPRVLSYLSNAAAFTTANLFTDGRQNSVLCMPITILH
jgi:riboflavin synthase